MKIIKALWFGLAIVVLAITLYGFDNKSNSDIWIVLTWFMLALSFPAGLLVSLLHMCLGEVFSITVKTTYFSLALEWLIYFVIGYLQWFKLVPYLLTKLHNLRKKRNMVNQKINAD